MRNCNNCNKFGTVNGKLCRDCIELPNTDVEFLELATEVRERSPDNAQIIGDEHGGILFVENIINTYDALLSLEDDYTDVTVTQNNDEVWVEIVDTVEA